MLAEYLDQIKAVAGGKRVQRCVCGECYDFKVVTSLDAASFGDWEGAAFSPEAEVLEKLKAIPGVTSLETQTYTFMDM